MRRTGNVPAARIGVDVLYDTVFEGKPLGVRATHVHR